jgi:uncharacterized Zn finger protein (UPF0148 family)
MPYCPECGYEYREGITSCPDCDRALVSQLPQSPRKPPPSEDSHVVIYEAQDALESKTIKAVLEDAGIPVAEKLYRTSGVFEDTSSTRVGIIYSRLITLQSRAEEAKQIIADFLEACRRGKLNLSEEPQE